jgi:hypothetical protein
MLQGNHQLAKYTNGIGKVNKKDSPDGIKVTATKSGQDAGFRRGACAFAGPGPAARPHGCPEVEPCGRLRHPGIVAIWPAPIHARPNAGQYDTMKSKAQRRLGTLFNQADYPSTLDGLFDMEWSVVPIEPPQYLVALSPDLFQQEQARVRERFESAVELAEQAFCNGTPAAHSPSCATPDWTS